MQPSHKMRKRITTCQLSYTIIESNRESKGINLQCRKPCQRNWGRQSHDSPRWSSGEGSLLPAESTPQDPRWCWARTVPSGRSWAPWRTACSDRSQSSKISAEFSKTKKNWTLKPQKERLSARATRSDEEIYGSGLIKAKLLEGAGVRIKVLIARRRRSNGKRRRRWPLSHRGVWEVKQLRLARRKRSRR